MGKGKRQREDVASPSSAAPRCASGPPRLTSKAARNLLHGFDVDGDESMEFLTSLIASETAPRGAVDELYGTGLMAAAEDWDLMLWCAVAMNKQQQQQLRGDFCRGIGNDRLLQGNSNIHLFACLDGLLGGEPSRLPEGSPIVVKKEAQRNWKPRGSRTIKQNDPAQSPYWTDEPQPVAEPQPMAEPQPKRIKVEIKREFGKPDAAPDGSPNDTAPSEPPQEATKESDLNRNKPASPSKSPPPPPPPTTPSAKKRGTTSRHFCGSSPTLASAASARPVVGQQTVLLQGDSAPKQGITPRPPGGAVSGLPFPPLTAARFGLIQEEVAHDPFRLLVAVRLLVKTAGRAAIPVFRALSDRYPAGAADVAAADPDELLGMIRHLGLGTVRRRAILRLARAWLRDPPSRGVRYGVKNYPRRGDGADVRLGERFGPEYDEHDEGDGDGDDDGDGEAAASRGAGSAWEIGHMTQGPYALDSWRIFCRDELLGRAAGKEEEEKSCSSFQPEWMRVRPADKELRAYLRWMWMREGWDWDPETGEREVLAEELRRAVDEGRVGYDDLGRLRIVS
ncbi:hypothetical protein RB601_007224 [Gaeumannomyces tritici]